MATVGTATAGERFFARIHWGAVIAGVFLALGAHIVMGLIGAAIGFAAEPADSEALGIGAAIWALLTPFVATLVGAWLAIRLSGEEDRNAGYVHGVLVWCIGLVAGALFLTGTAATGAMTAGTAASGNLGSAQRMVRGNTGQVNATGRTTEAQADQAGKAAAAATGGAALAAIAGLLGAVLATGLAHRRGKGSGLGWKIAIQRRDERREGAHAGDQGRFGEAYRPATTTGPYGGRETRPGELPRDEGAPDPYHH
jgi:hypothetical protein